MSEVFGGGSVASPSVKIQNDQSTPPWMRRVPMVTGALAALAGFLTVRGTNLSNDAIYRNTVAARYQTKSSDAWAEYQADSLKKHNDTTALMASDLSPENRAALQAEAKQFSDRQPALKEQAEKDAAQVDKETDNGHALRSEKDMTDYAGVAAQLGIAMASVAALTKKSAAFYIGVCCGLAGVVITGWSLAAHFFH